MFWIIVAAMALGVFSAFGSTHHHHYYRDDGYEPDWDSSGSCDNDYREE